MMPAFCSSSALSQGCLLGVLWLGACASSGTQPAARAGVANTAPAQGSRPRGAPQTGAQEADGDDAATRSAHLHFADLLVREFQKAQLGVEFRYDPARFALESTGDEELTFFLSDSYREYQAAPETLRPVIIARRVENVRAALKPEPIEPLEQARARLLPIVSTRLYFDAGSLDQEAAGRTVMQVAYTKLDDLLAIGLGLDSETRIALVNQRHLEAWKQPIDQLLSTAVENLRKLSSEPFEQVAPGVYQSPWRDSYDSSRLLVPDLFRNLPLKGAPVVLVPNRNVLLVAGDQDAPALLKMAEVAQDLMNGPKSISAIALRHEASGWKPYVPTVSDEVRRRYDTLRVQTQAMLYAEQKDLLDRVHLRRGHDVYVDKVMVIKAPKDDSLVTLSVWAKDVQTLLPRTDFIALYDPTRDKDNAVVGVAEWDTAAKVLGATIQPMGMSPERYQVKGFPSPQQLAKLNLRPLDAVTK